jgi:hypothetical protein
VAQGGIDQIQVLYRSYGPVGPLACPARFERATYALEAEKMSYNNCRNNSFKVLAFGVAYTPRTVVLSAIGWSWYGFGRRLDCHISNLSGKPTFLECPYMARMVIINMAALIAPHPKHTDCKPWIRNTN